MQSPMTIEQCEFTAFVGFKPEKVEGPFPSNLVIRNNVFKRGRGNPRLAVAFLGPTIAQRSGRPSAIHKVIFENNEVWGDFLMQGVDDVKLSGNRFPEAGAKKMIMGCRNLQEY